MFIDVNKIPPEGLEVDRALAIPSMSLGSGEQAALEGARLRGNFRRVRADVEFRGAVEAVITLTCSRCLTSFNLPVESDCHRIFRPGPLGNPESEHELDEADSALTPFDGERIDLEEIALEQFYLAVPLKPLCRESCRGLCPRCGAERNSSPCGCPDETQESEPLTAKLSL